MPILTTPFTCSNGHSFTANAKLRARCPECGVLAKKSFTPTVPTVLKTKEPKPTDVKPTVRKTPLLVREGRPRLVPKLKKAITKPVTKKAPVALKRPIVKKPVKALGKTVSGIVKIQRVTRVATPQVTGRPKRTAIARHIRVPKKESFMDSITRRFGPG